jgi:hypothetical protein
MDGLLVSFQCWGSKGRDRVVSVQVSNYFDVSPAFPHVEVMPCYADTRSEKLLYEREETGVTGNETTIELRM